MQKEQASEFVFTSQDKKPYTSNTMWKRAWVTTLKRADSEYCRFHDLRHTFVSKLIVNEKEDFATVMALSGHKRMSMLKRYSHTQETAKRAAFRKLEKYVKIITLDTYSDTKSDKYSSPNSSSVAQPTIMIKE
jgi:integrase